MWSYVFLQNKSTQNTKNQVTNYLPFSPYTFCEIQLFIGQHDKNLQPQHWKLFNKHDSFRKLRRLSTLLALVAKKLLFSLLFLLIPKSETIALVYFKASEAGDERLSSLAWKTSIHGNKQANSIRRTYGIVVLNQS